MERVVFTGGGTGGHIYPIIAIARELRKINREVELFFLGPNNFKDVLEKEGIKTGTILAAKIRRYFSLNNLIDILKAPIGLLQTFWHMFIWMPDAVFNKGGYGGVPIVLVAWLFRIPVLTHESDSIPGLANRFASKFSKRIAISFPSTEKYFKKEKTALIGNPVRREIVDYKNIEEAKRILQIVTDKPVIFIFGGSQGAQIINEIILAILPSLLENYEVIHQAGARNFQAIEARIYPGHSSYHLFPFLNEERMKAAFLLSTLVISRAGGSIFEIAACAKPSILIPLPNAAGNHQRENAYQYAQYGGAVVLEQTNLTPNILLTQINKVVSDTQLIKGMSQGASNFSRPEAAEKIAQGLIELMK